MHFVGFKDDRVVTARRVFGRPDFYHRVWDFRAWQESSVPGDTIIFADGTEAEPPRATSWDDSQQDIIAYATKEERR